MAMTGGLEVSLSWTRCLTGLMLSSVGVSENWHVAVPVRAWNGIR